MVELYGGLTVLSRIVVISLELAVPLIVFFGLVKRRKDGALQLRALDYMEEIELDHSLQNIAIAILGLVTYFYAYDLIIDVLEFATVPYLGLMIVGLPRTTNILILAVSMPVIVGVLYYYLHENRALNQRIQMVKSKLESMNLYPY